MADRVAWAVELLAPAPGEHVLEIGCGRGVAVERLGAAGCAVTALDRSATAIAAARVRNAALETAGQARFVCADLHGAALSAAGFDAALAVNVNLFWLQPTSLHELARLLAPRGRAVLAYDPPGAAQLTRIAQSLSAGLPAAGLSCEIRRADSLVAALARPI